MSITCVIEDVSGSKGKGGGQAHVATESPNTLFSRQTVRVLNVVSEGEISSVDGVYFDDTPISNYARSSYEVRTGTTSQTYIPGYSSVESEINVSTKVTNSTSVSKAVSSTSINALRLSLQVDALYTTNTSNGDTKGRSVQLAIDTRPNSGGIWTQILTVTISGKTMDPYVRAIRVNAPSGATLWECRVRRITADETLASVASDTRWVSYTEIQDVTLTYDNTALVGIRADAEATGGKIPVVSFDVTGIKVKIPSNYNPTTRAYSGVWDGLMTSTRYYTNNPAWVLYDLLTNTRYGLGKRISEANIDKYSFYRASVYNDVLVDNGKGGTEPRFTFNGVINSQDQAAKILQSVASCMSSYLIDTGGVITLIQDRPTNSSQLITNNDVIDGKFVYQSSSLRARHSAVNTSYNDPNDRYLLKTVSEGDSTALTRYGLNSLDDVAVGCTSEAQARRQARLKLYAEINQLEIVKFSVGFRNCIIFPGDVVEIQDQVFAEVKYNGIVSSATTTSVVLADSITLANEAYTIMITDNTLDTDVNSDTYGRLKIESKAITQTNGTFTTLTPTTAFTSAPNTNSTVIVKGSVVPKKFKIVSVLEADKGRFEITGLQYDANKWSWVESGITLETPVYTTSNLYTQQAPTGFSAAEEIYTDANVTYKRIRVSWIAPRDYSDNTGTATAGSTTTITLPSSGAATTDDFYKNWKCTITGGTGSGQTAYVLSYNATTRVCTFSTTLGVALNNTSQYTLTSPTSLKSTYTVKWNRDNGEVITESPLNEPQLFINNVVPGMYQFWITATNVRGVTSDTLEGSYNYLSTTGSTLIAVTNLIAKGGSGTTYSTPNLTINWTNPANNINLTGGVTTPVKDYVIEIWTSDGLTKKSTYYSEGTLEPTTLTGITLTGGSTTTAVLPAATASQTTDFYKGWTLTVTGGTGSGQTAVVTGYNASTYTLSFAAIGTGLNNTSIISLTSNKNEINSGGSFVYTFQQNTIDFGTATRNFIVKIYPRDSMLRLGAVTSATFSNPAPATISATVTAAVNSVFVSMTPPADQDVIGYQVWGSTTTGFTPGSGNLLYDGPDTQFVHATTGGTTWFYKVAAYDTFGKTGLNISSQYTTTTLSSDATSWALSGITFVPNSPSSNRIAWSAGEIIKYSGGTQTTYSISASNVLWSSGALYIYFNPTISTTAIQSTSTLATAVAAGGFIIGVYRGGNDFSFNNGKAFIDGSTILAATVGANQLITGSAVITGSAQIQDAIITDAKITGAIQSSDFSTGAAGWRINKAGNAELNNAVFRGTLAVKSATSGARMEVTNSTIRVYDANGVVRVKLGDLA